MSKNKTGNNISKSKIKQGAEVNGYIREFDCGISHIYTCFKQKVEDGWKFNGEIHDFWEMVCVTDGFMYIAEDNRIYKLTKGDIIFHKPMEFHRIWCENSPHSRFMVISFGANDEFFEPLGEKVIKLNLEKSGELEELYNEMHRTFDINLHVYVKAEGKRNLIREKMTILKFELFLLSLLDAEKVPEARQHSIGAQNYKLIIDTMTENINKNLTIEELAKLCNLSVSNLKKTFNKYGSGGVIKYFNRMRIQRAIQFLRKGDSIAGVSREMGFSSQNYFSVMFKRETGILPSEFKKKDLPNW